MNALELLNIIGTGETSTVQFKEMLDNSESIAAEMIAMSNSKGGMILFGVEDKTGDIIGLDYSQIQSIGNRVATIANDLIKPQIFISTEVVSLSPDVTPKNILVVYVEEGTSKPYKDRNGSIWIKQGGDKRRLTDNNEQIRLFQQSGILYADEMVIPDTGLDDIDEEKVKTYLRKVQDDSIAISKENAL